MGQKIPQLLSRCVSMTTLNALNPDHTVKKATLRNQFERYDKPRNYQDSLFSLSSLPHTHPSGGGDLVCKLRILQQ
jgi:hypothetical protein